MSVIDQSRRLDIQANPWTVRRFATNYEPPTEEFQHGNGRLYLPKHQRLWSWKNKRGLKKMQELIDSILHNYPIPTVILNAKDDGSRERWEIYDGRHRVETIWRFVNNKFGIPVDDREIFYKDLTDTDRARFNDREIPVVVTSAASPFQLAEVFIRLNSGKSLSQADYCHASRDTPLVSGTLAILEENKARFRTLFGGSDITKRETTPDWVGIVLGLSTGDASNMTTSFERIQVHLDEEIDKDAVDEGMDALFELYTRAAAATNSLPTVLKRYERVGFINAFFFADWLVAEDKEFVIANWLQVIKHIRTTNNPSIVTVSGAQNLTTAKIHAVLTKVHAWLATGAVASQSDDSDSD